MTNDTTMEKRKLTVIIPCYNKLLWTQKTVDSLLACSRSDLHLILIDDCSTDGTREFAEQTGVKMNALEERFFFLRNEINVGVNASWNIGVRMALTLDTPYICIANNDLAFTNGWDLPLLDALDADYWLVSPYSTERNLPRDWPAGQTRHTNPANGIMSILGACFMFRSELIAKIGYFPEQCRYYYGDNWIQDACKLRRLKAGHIYESYIHHFLCQTTKELDNNKWFRQDRAAYDEICKKFNLRSSM